MSQGHIAPHTRRKTRVDLLLSLGLVYQPMSGTVNPPPPSARDCRRLGAPHSQTKSPVHPPGLDSPSPPSIPHTLSRRSEATPLANSNHKPAGYRYVTVPQGWFLFTNTETYGRGAYGRVRSGVFINTQKKNTDVAVKKTTRDDYLSTRRELAAYQRLSHPNIVKVWGCFFIEDPIKPPKRPLVLIMNYYRPINSQTVEMSDPSIFVTVFLGVSDALVYMHNNQIIHNDVKLDNLLMDIPSFSGIISDFGIWIERNGTNPCPSITGGSHCPPEAMAYRTCSSKVPEDLTKIDSYGLGEAIKSVFILIHDRQGIRLRTWPANLVKKIPALIAHCTVTNPNTRYSMPTIHDQFSHWLSQHFSIDKLATGIHC